jgi:hypothetical protein
MSPSESHLSTATSKPGRRIGSMLRHLLVAATGSALLLASSAFVGEQPAPTARQDPGEAAIAQATPHPATPSRFLLPSLITPTPSQMSAITLVVGKPRQCCWLPSWSSDSRTIAFLRRESAQDPAAYSSVEVLDGTLKRLSDRVGILSSDWSYLAYPERSQAFIEDRSTGKRWIAPSDGREIHFSPSGRAIAWEAGSKGYTYPDMRQRAIWLAGIDGSNPGQVAITWGGRFIGWTTDEKAILVSGRLESGGVSGLWRLEDGKGYLLLEAENVREALVSPQGGWVAFYVAFSSEAEQNGLWAVSTDGTMARRLSPFGSYRWRDEGQLLIIPLDLEAPGPELIQVDVPSGVAVPLTDAKHTPLDIAGNDWQPSPDGQWIVYVAHTDGSLRLIRLPQPTG